MIPKEVWIEIGQETAEAVRYIPAGFIRVLGNIANDVSNFTVESWSFWFMYIAPIVLKVSVPKEEILQAHVRICKHHEDDDQVRDHAQGD